MKIKKATQKDSPEIVKIDNEAFGDSGITAKMVTSQLNSYPEGALIAIDENKILGVAFCERHKKQQFPSYVHDVSRAHQKNGKLFYLSVITVRQDSRGKGVGTRLLKAVDDLSKKSGGVKIYCPVNKKHPYLKKGVLQFWMKNDYRIIGNTSWKVSPGRFLDSYIFEKSDDFESKSFELAKSYLGKEIKLIIDRPLGSKHPKHGFLYEANYGFVPNTLAPDGEETDAYFLGINKPVKKAKGKCIAIVHRLNDDDDKLVVIPPEKENMTDEEIAKSVHFQEQWFEYEILRK